MKKRILLCGLLAGILAALLLCFPDGAAAEAKWPSGSPNGIKSDGKLKIDVTNTSEGYFMAAVTSQNKKKLKLRVVMEGETITYDLNGSGEFEVFPFQLGSGKYSITLYENVKGKTYSAAGAITIRVDLSREDAPFLYPNQYVNYTAASEAVGMADSLCKGLGVKDSYDAIKKFITSTFLYDYIKAVTVQAGTLPDIDGSFAKKMGVCQDLSAIMVCMLRTQEIPARLIIGYADKNYHAWIMTTIDGKDIYFDPTAALNAINKPTSYSVERYY